MNQWTYNQANGNLSRDGKLVATGYSGLGSAKNNGFMETVHDVGPIPRGKYAIAAWRDTENLGPIVCSLVPLEGTDTHGRSGFLIHGDSLAHPGAASHGCIILSRPARVAIRDSKVELLEVV